MDSVTITRFFPNGAVTAMMVYDVGGFKEWCIVVFPNHENAYQFSRDNHMEFHYSDEAAIQRRALNEALEARGLPAVPLYPPAITHAP